MLGHDQPVILQLLEVTPALKALAGVAMELDDCAFPLLAGVVQTDDANVAFGDSEYALLVGAMPRKAGMERADLLSANGGIFKPQGEAIAASAKKNIKVLVVGNPANTNALIAMNHAKGIDPRQFTAMTRLDHNRAISQLAHRIGKPVSAVKKMTIWGNHSTTQYPDLYNCEVDRQNAAGLVNDQEWYREDFHSDRCKTRRGDSGSPRLLFGCFRRQCGHRSHSRLGARHPGRRLGQHGRP